MDRVVVMDTETSPAVAVAGLLRQVYAREVPHVVVGGSDEVTVLDLSVVTSGLEIPFVAYGGFNQRVITPFYYPYSTRTSSGLALTAERIASYLLYQGRTNYWALYNAVADTAIQLKEKIQLAATSMDIIMAAQSYVPVSHGADDREAWPGLEELRDTGFRTFILVVEVPAVEIPVLARAADDLGMINDDNFWVLVGAFDPNFYETDLSQQSPTTQRLLRGAAVVREIDLFVYRPTENRFLTSWQNQNASLVSLLNEKNPVGRRHAEYIFAQDNYFQEHLPGFGASFAYDSVMAAGMGFCRTRRDTNETHFVVEQIHRTEFHGASGFVEFRDQKGTPGQRQDHTVTFGVLNLLHPNSTDDRSYVVTEIWEGTEKRRNNLKWQSIQPFVYADGTTTAPLLLRDPPNQNYLSTEVQSTGLALFTFAFSLIVISVVWITIYRNHAVVKASQPIFLYMLAFGSLLISGAIFTNSFDESYGWTTNQLGNACASTPWLLIVGHIINYSALFTKLWRVNKVLQFRRRRVEIQHVVWPMGLLVLTAIGLLTAWFLVEGFRWERIVLDEYTGESIGKCEGNHTAEWFVPIFLLTIVPTIMTLIMAIKTRDVEATYSESNWIFVLILIQLQVLFVSIPVLNILETVSTEGRYTGQVMIFWTFAVSPVVLIVGPKVVSVYRRNQERQKRGQRSNGRVSGIASSGDVRRIQEEYGDSSKWDEPHRSSMSSGTRQSEMSPGGRDPSQQLHSHGPYI